MATYTIAAGESTTLVFRTYDPATGDLAAVSNGLLGMRKNGALQAPPIGGVSPSWGPSGVNTVAVDTSVDPAFFENGSEYALEFTGGTVAGNDISNDGPNDILLSVRNPIGEVWSQPNRELTSAANITHNGQPIPRGDTCAIGMLSTGTTNRYLIAFHEDVAIKNNVQSATIDVSRDDGSMLMSGAALTQSGSQPNAWLRIESTNLVAPGQMVHVMVNAVWDSGDTIQQTFSNVIAVPAASA